MNVEHTQYQSDREQEKARELSLQRTRPPVEVPGYEAQKFLGAGAYGEVWVALDAKTGRQVAIKFYTHQGGLDWSLLEREVHKLVTLSADRYVVQLLDVGWTSKPPYYVMEYIESGSLDDYLRSHGPMPLAEAVQVFRLLCIGLMHAHAKGVLHCDLKPANVLIDQDLHPRLADFGQSRMSTEQKPALGTLFFMAPEQADLEALPDAKWDVYALGAILHTMLIGAPPHRSPDSTRALESATDLPDRLARYRELLQKSDVPTRHRQTPGIDNALCEIIERCIAPNPSDRFPNVQSVVDALDAREELRARQPLLVLGLVGPAILLAIIIGFGWWINATATSEAEDAIAAQAGRANQNAARYVSQVVGHEIERYYRAVETVASDPEFRAILAKAVHESELGMMARELADAKHMGRNAPSKDAFVAHPDRRQIQEYMETLQRNPDPPANSWFVTDAAGVQLAAAFEKGIPTDNIGRCYAWRSYFSGLPDDSDPTDRPGKHVSDTHLSAVFRSSTTGTWKVAISAPVYRTDPAVEELSEEDFLGVVVATVELGDFVKFHNEATQYALLVDDRPGSYQGMILQHPAFQAVVKKKEKVPLEFAEPTYRLDLAHWSDDYGEFRDPIDEYYRQGESPRRWIAGRAGVTVRRGTLDEAGQETIEPTGLVVLVQEDGAKVTAPVTQLSRQMFFSGLTAIGLLLLVMTGLWFFVIRVLRDPARAAARRTVGSSEPTPLHNMETVPAPSKMR